MLNKFIFLPLVFFYLFILSTTAFADYKIELVNGDPVIAKWYTLDRDREVVLYRVNAEIIEIPADNVLNILYFDPVAYENKLKEEKEQKEMEAALKKWNEALDRALLNTQEQHDEWESRRTVEPVITSQETEEPAKQYKTINDQPYRQNCEQKKIAKTAMDRYAEKLKNAEEYLWDVRRETYVSSSDHKKRERYARNRVEDAQTQFDKAKERFDNACR